MPILDGFGFISLVVLLEAVARLVGIVFRIVPTPPTMERRIYVDIMTGEKLS